MRATCSWHLIALVIYQSGLSIVISIAYVCLTKLSEKLSFMKVKPQQTEYENKFWAPLRRQTVQNSHSNFSFRKLIQIIRKSMKKFRRSLSNHLDPWMSRSITVYKLLYTNWMPRIFHVHFMMIYSYTSRRTCMNTPSTTSPIRTGLYWHDFTPLQRDDTKLDRFPHTRNVEHIMGDDIGVGVHLPR
jgi:hypothetical protein